MSTVKVISEEEIVSEIKELCNLVETSIGPNGRYFVVVNLVGLLS